MGGSPEDSGRHPSLSEWRTGGPKQCPAGSDPWLLLPSRLVSQVPPSPHQRRHPVSTPSLNCLPSVHDLFPPLSQLALIPFACRSS